MADEEPVANTEETPGQPEAAPEPAADAAADAAPEPAEGEPTAPEPAAPVEGEPSADPATEPPAAEEDTTANENTEEAAASGEALNEAKDSEEAATGETAKDAAESPEATPGEEEAVAEGDKGPEEGEEPPADGAEKPEGGDEVTTEQGEAGETVAAEGEEVAAGAEPSPPADGEAADGEPRPESQEAPKEGESVDQPPAEEAVEGEEKPGSAVPQSDTFADGEKPESPAPHVGEVLSRDGSPSSRPKEEEEGHAFTPPVPGESPRDSHVEDQFEIEALEEEIISPEQDREALVEMYHLAIAEREQLQQQNHQLQHKLAEYFKKKKSDEQKTEAVDKNEADQEQRYLKYMSQLEELRAEDQQIRDTYAMEIEDLEHKCQERNEEVDAHRAKFVEFKHQVALNSLNSRSGKPIPPKDIEKYLADENRKDQEVIGVRLENIKLKNKLKKKEQQLKSKEELADGLHLIDFEQLKIENQTYNEKIEERNEELLKLRKKITNTVQVLTHLKEKLQFVQGENSTLKNKLKEVEGAVAQKRDVLTRTKQARDALRIDNHRLRQNCGLLGNEPLLRDFEERKDEADALKDRLERLKMQHAELTLNTSSVRRKIEQIKANERS